MKNTKYITILTVILMYLVPHISEAVSNSKKDISIKIKTYEASPPIHVYKSKSSIPTGVTPDFIKHAYNIPLSGGQGTIAIIGAYHNKTIESDLENFNRAFNISPCSNKNLCFEQKQLHASTETRISWSLETSLDVEWAHAIAPQAHILLIEAKSQKVQDLLEAVDYARKRKDVVAISMSWGGKEFAEEKSFDTYFTSLHPITFFAASGDNGSGVSWPASSPMVVGVGGTTLSSINGTLSEVAWAGSGGGVSQFELQPAYQKIYSIVKAKGYRAVPDVSYNADPVSGYPVYYSGSSKSKNNWYMVGGTSAGTPQWAAIQALGSSINHQNLYTDKYSSNSTHYFRDIVSGSNGYCLFYCEARKRYDYVTGLGSPLTVHF